MTQIGSLTHQARPARGNKARHEITFDFSISGTHRMKESHDLAATAETFGQPDSPFNEISQPPAPNPDRFSPIKSKQNRQQNHRRIKPRVFDLAEGSSERCEEIKRAFRRRKRAIVCVKRAFVRTKRAFPRLTRAFLRAKQKFTMWGGCTRPPLRQLAEEVTMRPIR